MLRTLGIALAPRTATCTRTADALSDIARSKPGLSR